MLLRAATVVQLLHSLFYVLLQLFVVTAIILSFKFYCKFYYVAARRHIFVCFMAKSALWRGFSALAPYTGVGPI